MSSHYNISSNHLYNRIYNAFQVLVNWNLTEQRKYYRGHKTEKKRKWLSANLRSLFTSLVIIVSRKMKIIIIRQDYITFMSN